MGRGRGWVERRAGRGREALRLTAVWVPNEISVVLASNGPLARLCGDARPTLALPSRTMQASMLRARVTNTTAPSARGRVVVSLSGSLRARGARGRHPTLSAGLGGAVEQEAPMSAG